MAGVPASSHGATFNGGTITTPLVVADTNNNDVPIQVNFSLSGINVSPFTLHSTDAGGADIVYVDSGGDFHVNTPAGNGAKVGQTQLALTDTSGSIFQVDRAAGLLVSGPIRHAPTAPGTVAISSGAAFAPSGVADVFLCVPFTGDATNNAATLLIQISPDNVIWTTLDTLSIAAALNLTGAINVPVMLAVPSGWLVKLTASHGTIGTGTFY